MIYVTSDIHGKTDEFFELLRLAEFGPEDKLYVLGDVIDRNGDGGIGLLQWIMEQSNVELLLGNHEAMMLACGFLFSEKAPHPLELPDIYYKRHMRWLDNGGNQTINALLELDKEKISEIYRYLWDRPAYKEVTVEDTRYILVHAGFENFAPDRELSSYTRKELLWFRPDPQQTYFDDAIVVCGHTPTVFFGCPNRVYLGPGWIDIDTGGAFEESTPMLLRLDDLTAFYIDSERKNK